MFLLNWLKNTQYVKNLQYLDSLKSNIDFKVTKYNYLRNPLNTATTDHLKKVTNKLIDEFNSKKKWWMYKIKEL